MFADIVVFLDSGQSRVGVTGADHSELVRVGAEFRPQLEPILKSFASVFVLQHVVLFWHCEVQITERQGLVVGKFII